MYTNMYNSWKKTITVGKKIPKMSAILYTGLKLSLMEFSYIYKRKT